MGHEGYSGLSTKAKPFGQTTDFSPGGGKHNPTYQALVKATQHLKKQFSMEAGKSNIKVGTYVKIKGVKGEDSFLNGKRGTVTHPFAFGATGKNWIGIVIDAGQ